MRLPQEALSERVRELCQGDRRLVAALTYGSFAQGVGDEHSDIEFWLFFGEAVAAEDWLRQIGPIQHLVVNEFGAHVVFFPGLIRGEFHFATAGQIATVATWPARGAPVDRMVVVDRTGELRAVLEGLPEQPVPTDPVELAGRFANWLVLAQHVAARGELLRAVDAMSQVQRHLLWMVRRVERRTGNWLTPSRRAEADLSPGRLAAIGRTCAVADPDALEAALAASWQLGRALWVELGVPEPAGLFAELDRCYPPSGS